MGGARSCALRLTPRGRALLAGSPLTQDPNPSKFVDTQALRVGRDRPRIASVLALGHFAMSSGRVGDQLDLLLTPPSLARALSAGIESDSLQISAYIESIAPLPDGDFSHARAGELGHRQGGARGRRRGSSGSAIPTFASFLRTRRPAAELFVDPSPPGGLFGRSRASISSASSGAAALPQHRRRRSSRTAPSCEPAPSLHLPARSSRAAPACGRAAPKPNPPAPASGFRRYGRAACVVVVTVQEVRLLLRLGIAPVSTKTTPALPLRGRCHHEMARGSRIRCNEMRGRCGCVGNLKKREGRRFRTVRGSA